MTKSVISTKQVKAVGDRFQHKKGMKRGSNELASDDDTYTADTDTTASKEHITDAKKGSRDDLNRDEDSLMRARNIRRKKKARLVAYRALAIQAGYNRGVDTTQCLLSSSDAVRLMTFLPQTPDSTSFGYKEFEQRHATFAQGIPASAAKESQIRCDAILRSTLNEAVLRTIEAGKKHVRASTMRSVLRDYTHRMMFTSVVPPLGLIRFAQDRGTHHLKAIILCLVRSSVYPLLRVT
jgi:SNF2 family DNA or RNA helicase